MNLKHNSELSKQHASSLQQSPELLEFTTASIFTPASLYTAAAAADDSYHCQVSRAQMQLSAWRMVPQLKPHHASGMNTATDG
jgi:hypothetical protein